MAFFISQIGGKEGLFNMYYYENAKSSYLAVPVCFYHYGELIYEGEYCASPCDITSTSSVFASDKPCIFPNPATNIFYIDPSCLDKKPVTIVIRNVQLKEVKKEVIGANQNGMAAWPMDIESLTNAIYFVSAFSGDQYFGTQKLIIAR